MHESVSMHMEGMRVISKCRDIPDCWIVGAHLKRRVVRKDESIESRESWRLGGVELSGRHQIYDLRLPDRGVSVTFWCRGRWSIRGGDQLVVAGEILLIDR